MLQLAIFILGQGGENTAEAPDGGVGAGLIIGAIVLAAIIFATILFVFHKRSQASRGGIEPPRFEKDQEPHPSKPPLESIEPRS